jgi:hypothetical protein
MDAEQDRLARQARRQSVWREESSGTSPFQAADPFTSPHSIRRPRRTDTGISPLDPNPHPGRRLPSIRDSIARRFTYVAPGTNGETRPKPFEATLERVEEVSPAQGSSLWPNVASGGDEDPLAHIERAASSARTSVSYTTRLFNLLLRRSPVRHRGRSGLHVAAAIATAHVPAFLKLEVQEGLVYISEYEKGMNICPNLSALPDIYQRRILYPIECQHLSIAFRTSRVS